VKKKTDGIIMIELTTEVEALDIYYTLDNSVPNHYHPKYTGPIVFPKGADQFRLISYKAGKPAGRIISIKSEDLAKRITK
jgi:hexosaminidase